VHGVSEAEVVENDLKYKQGFLCGDDLESGESSHINDDVDKVNEKLNEEVNAKVNEEVHIQVVEEVNKQVHEVEVEVEVQMGGDCLSECEVQSHLRNHLPQVKETDVRGEEGVQDEVHHKVEDEVHQVDVEGLVDVHISLDNGDHNLFEGSVEVQC